jgi:hypothetical protein
MNTIMDSIDIESDDEEFKITEPVTGNTNYDISLGELDGKSIGTIPTPELTHPILIIA